MKRKILKENWSTTNNRNKIWNSKYTYWKIEIEEWPVHLPLK